MASFGSLIFYKKNGVSEPFSLSYGKTSIGSSAAHHIRIKDERQISCILDSNEVGVTILVNENEHEDILINNEPTSKYTVLRNEDHLEVGKKKFKYLNPSLKEEYLEQAQQTLNKKLGTMTKINSKSLMDINPSTPLKRLQKETILAKQRRFSTGSKFATAKDSPKNVDKFLSPCRPMGTSQSPSKVRSFRRALAGRNSMLAPVMENEAFNIHNSKNSCDATDTPQSSFQATLKSPSTKKNKSFSGNSEFSSPIPAKNKTYSGNISDISENITTPENNVSVASITPLNISKKTKTSLNRSRTLSYVDFPNSSTPKSAIKMNRSSSWYRPLLEDITPASPLPRSSFRNSSLKKLAFTQRRSVNFNISSSSDHSSRQESDSVGVLQETSAGSKRKISNVADTSQVSSGRLKKRKSNSSRVLHKEGQEDRNSPHDSSISEIENLSNTSLTDEDESANKPTSSRSIRNISSKDEVNSRNQSIVSWNLEVSSSDMNISGLSELSCVAETPLKSKRSMRLSKSLVEKINQSMESTSQYFEMEGQSCRKSLENISTSNLESILDDSLNDSSGDLKSSISSRSRRYSIKISDKGKGSIRSQSLDLKRMSKRSVNKHSKTLGNNLRLDILEHSRSRNITSTPTLRSTSGCVYPKRKSVSELRSKSLNMESNVSNSPHVPSKASSSMSLDLSPVNTSPIDFSKDSKSTILSRSRRASIRIQGKEKGRSKSLNLRKDTKESVNKHSKTLDSILTPSISDQKRKSISKTRSKSLNLRNKLASSLYVSSKTSKSMTLEFSPMKSNNEISENNLNETNSLISAQSTSSSVFVNSMSEINDSTRPSESRSKYNSEDSVTSESAKQNVKIPMVVITRSSLSSTNIESPARSRSSFRSRSMVVSDDGTSEFSSVSSNMSSCNSSMNDVNNSTNVDAVFKTPNLKRAPRKLVETPNLSFESTNDPTNIKPMEELLQENFERSSRRSTRFSNLIEESFTDVEDRESFEKSVESGSAESLKETSSSNFSFEIPSRRTTPRNIKNMSKLQGIPNDLTEVARAEEIIKTPKVLMSSKTEQGNLSSIMKSRTPKAQNSPKNDLTNVAGVKNLQKTPKVTNSPKNDLSNVKGIKRLLQTPKIQKSPHNDLSDIRGIKKLLKTPKTQKSPRNDLTNVGGLKKFMKTPKVQKSPNNDLTNIRGVKKLMNTPKVQNSPRNDLSNIKGIKKLMKTPKVQKSPKNDLTNVGGVKKLMTTPKLQKSPKNDLTNVGGVKKLMTTPKLQRSPKNDLTTVGGVKKLMTTPKLQKSPKNDLTNVGGVKKLLTTPKLHKSPNNDLTKVTGLKKLMASPKQQKSPKNDLTDVKGIRKFLKTPRAQNSPKNDLLDVRGIRNLLRTPKNKAADESHDLSGIDILFNQSQESNFDKLLNKKPPRTYGRSPKLNKSQEQLDKPETPEHVLKWLEDQSNLEPAIPVESRKGKRKLAQTSDAPQENTVTPIKKQKVTRSTRANKDESMLNISSTIIDKPSSTPNVDKKNTPHTSQAELSNSTQTTKENEQVGTRRGKRKLENDDREEEKPSLKRTRGKKSSKTEAEDNDIESEIKTPDNKTTRKTRQTKQKPDSIEQPPKENNTRPRRGGKKKESNKDQISLDTEKNENKQTTKRTRSNKGTEKSTYVEEEIKESIKNTRNKRGKLQVEIGNIEDDSMSKKRGKGSKQKETEQEYTNIDGPESKLTATNNKNVKEIVEESIGHEDMPESIPRRRRIVKKEEISDIQNEVEPKKRGRRNKKIDQKTTEPECEKQTNKGEIEEEKNESTSHKDGKNNKKNECEKKDKPKPQLKKNTRSAKIEDTIPEETEKARTTRSNKGKTKKYNEEEWDTPGKKHDKKQKVTFKENVEYLQTPAESSTDGTRTLRKRRNLKL